MLGHFTPDMIFKARDALWHICDHDIIGPYKRRNKTPSRPAHDSTIDDIISALTKLDAVRCMPTIVIRADDLALIPRSHPEELNDISLLDRLNRLEARVTSLQEGLDHTMCENHNIKDMISQMPVKATYSAVTQVNSRPNNSTAPTVTITRPQSRPQQDLAASAPSITNHACK